MRACIGEAGVGEEKLSDIMLWSLAGEKDARVEKKFRALRKCEGSQKSKNVLGVKIKDLAHGQDGRKPERDDLCV